MGGDGQASSGPSSPHQFGRIMRSIEVIQADIQNAESRHSAAVTRCDQISANRWRQESEALLEELRAVKLEQERARSVEGRLAELQQAMRDRSWSDGRTR